jgi:hypothetical protein
MFPSQFLNAEKVKAGPLVVKITSVVEEEVRDGDGTARKWVLHCITRDRAQHALILNPTNTNLLVEATGTDIVEEWTGKVISLFFDPNVFFAGKKTGGVRIGRAAAPAPPPPPPPPQPTADEVFGTDDDIPF